MKRVTDRSSVLAYLLLQRGRRGPRVFNLLLVVALLLVLVLVLALLVILVLRLLVLALVVLSSL